MLFKIEIIVSSYLVTINQKSTLGSQGTHYRLEYVERSTVVVGAMLFFKITIATGTPALSSLDHDVAQKGSIIPTVDMICTVPETIDEGFYRGVVNIKLKEGLF